MLTRVEIVALTLVPGMTGSAVRRLDAAYTSIAAVAASPAERLAMLGLRRSAIEGLQRPGRVIERADELMRRCEALQIDVLLWREERFPTRLDQIYAAPPLLYVKGELRPEDGEGVAVVGTRSATPYGRLSAENYARSIARCGVTVVSGLARGIDTFAHVAALEAGGRTVAVIASGFDRIEPTTAARLAQKIVDAGAVVSEYPPGVKAVPAYFPQRNRIISGMARGTLVIESDEKGGSMITAGFALDQNREVFALPGPVTSGRSRGTNLLIRTDRARLTQTPEDLLEALGHRIPAIADRRIDRASLGLFEERIVDALDAGPSQIDELAESTGMPTSELLVTLLDLEFKGIVRQMAGKVFVLAQ